MVRAAMPSPNTLCERTMPGKGTEEDVADMASPPGGLIGAWVT